MNPQEVLAPAIQLFPREDGAVSIWDHPNFKSRVTLPDDYFGFTRLEQGLEMLNQGRLHKQDLVILKVVGDAMCANENQLRRYMAKKQSYSQTSGSLTRLRKFGFVERHLCRLAFIEEEGEEVVKPPAPYTLGIAGYKLMKHLYSESDLVMPDYWMGQPLAVQRYVAVNEMRCLAVEADALRGWKWSPYIGGSPKYKRPLAVAKLETPKGELQLLIDRPQMAQNFLGYLRSKMEQYRNFYERDKAFQIDGFSKKATQIVCLHVSSLSMARFIQEELRLHTYPFDIWILVDEQVTETSGLSEAFYMIKDKTLKRIRVPFLAPKQ